MQYPLCALLWSQSQVMPRSSAHEGREQESGYTTHERLYHLLSNTSHSIHTELLAELTCFHVTIHPIEMQLVLPSLLDCG